MGKTDEIREIKGYFEYEQDSKRFHRFKVDAGEGITGSLYILKDMTPMPKRLILEYKKEG